MNFLSKTLDVKFIHLQQFVMFVMLIMIVFANVSVSLAQDETPQLDTNNIIDLQKIWCVNEAHNFGITSVIFHPARPDTLFTSSLGDEDNIKFWSYDETLATDDCLNVEVATAYIFEDQHIGDVTSLALNQDGDRLLSAGVDKTINVWNIKELADSNTTVEQVLSGHTNWIFSVSFVPDARQIFSGSVDNTAILWDLVTEKPLHTLTGFTNGIYSVDVSPDGTIAATGSCNILTVSEQSRTGFKCVEGAVYIYDLETADRIHLLKGHLSTVYSVKFSSNGKQLLTGSEDKSMILWDVTTGNIIQTFPSPDCIAEATCVNYESSIFAVSLSPDGRLAISGSADGRVIIWDVATGKSLWEYKYNGVVRTLAFNQQGTHFAVGTYGRELTVWGIQ